MHNQDYLCHYGVQGMRWGTRQQQKDFSTLKKSVKKSMTSGRNLEKSKTYQVYHPIQGDPRTSTMMTFNKKLLDIAKEHEKQTDSLISNLSKKYKDVSIIPDYNRKTGESFVEIYMAGHHEVIYERELDG